MLETIPLVCKAWRDILKKDQFWQILCSLMFTKRSEVKPTDFPSFKKYFISAFKSQEKRTYLPTLNQVMTLHIGGAGINLGLDFWDILGMEHHNGSDTEYEKRVFFSETIKGTFEPRSLFIDSNDETFSESKQTSIFSRSTSILHNNSTSCIDFWTGYSNVGTSMCSRSMEQMRRWMEKDGKPQAIMLMHSTGGGAGAGVTARILQKIRDQKLGKTISVSIYPHLRYEGNVGFLSNTSVATYNSILAMDYLSQYSDYVFTLDNEKLFSMPAQFWGTRIGDRFDTKILNFIPSHALADIACSLRNEIRSFDLNAFDLFPTLNHLSLSHAPIYPPEQSLEPSVPEITAAACQSTHFLSKCSPNLPWSSAILNFRGHLAPKDVMAAFGYIRSRRLLPTLDWSNGRMLCLMNYERPVYPILNELIYPMRRRVTIVGNNMSAGYLPQELLDHSQPLIKNRAFFHHMLRAGFEEEQLFESVHNIQIIANTYDEALAPSPDEENEGENEGEI
eukprot:TRINITY_DN4901_c0_g1_i1.p1 TRINITY_DN4901_c0_g1~~TRINITY_DN4901_c0_g1_i1.p1  ORF type:complete len:580 (-),score=89.63 TRINITY_DN4901_c0_g1_i1:141-1655(-)